jgi:hypothetical protein
MNHFGSETVDIMRAVLDDVCSHVRRNSTSARTFIASRILECASKGERTYDGLLRAARLAVIEQFGTVEVIRKRLEVMGANEQERLICCVHYARSPQLHFGRRTAPGMASMHCRSRRHLRVGFEPPNADRPEDV